MINLIECNHFELTSQTKKNFHKFYDNLLKNEHVSEIVKIKLLKSMSGHGIAELKDDSNSSKQESSLDNDTSI